MYKLKFTLLVYFRAVLCIFWPFSNLDALNVIENIYDWIKTDSTLQFSRTNSPNHDPSLINRIEYKWLTLYWELNALWLVQASDFVHNCIRLIDTQTMLTIILNTGFNIDCTANQIEKLFICSWEFKMYKQMICQWNFLLEKKSDYLIVAVKNGNCEK